MNKIIKIPVNKQLILFDGFCNLCNSSVQKIISLDVKNRFVFTSLNSKTATKILHQHHFNTSIDSILLYKNNQIHYKSSAILRIVSEFGLLWKLLFIFWIIPKPIRDFCYDIIAKNRYKWFGKRNKCMVPTKEIQQKFLD